MRQANDMLAVSSLHWLKYKPFCPVLILFALDRPETLQTGSDREHSNTLEVFNAGDWHAS